MNPKAAGPQCIFLPPLNSLEIPAGKVRETSALLTDPGTRIHLSADNPPSF